MNCLAFYLVGLIITGIAIGFMFSQAMGFLTIGIGLMLAGFMVLMYKCFSVK